MVLGFRPRASRAAAGALIAAALLPGCERKPEFVFVLEAPQVVELAAWASTHRVAAGEPLILQARRTTSGTWKRIPSRDLKPDQCWMAVVPPEEETAVADNLQWVVEPDGAATFNTGTRSDRARTVSLSMPGAYTITPSTSVWCEPGRSVAAPPLRIEVTAR